MELVPKVDIFLVYLEHTSCCSHQNYEYLNFKLREIIEVFKDFPAKISTQNIKQNSDNTYRWSVILRCLTAGTSTRRLLVILIFRVLNILKVIGVEVILNI